MSDQYIAVLAFALAITVMCGWIGFNEPSWSRTYTTAFRYRAALVVHLALYTGIFLLCFLVLRASLYAPDEREPVAALWLAFLAVGLARMVPPLARWPKALLHKAAGIPLFAQRYAE